MSQAVVGWQRHFLKPRTNPGTGTVLASGAGGFGVESQLGAGRTVLAEAHPGPRRSVPGAGGGKL